MSVMSVMVCIVYMSVMVRTYMVPHVPTPTFPTYPYFPTYPLPTPRTVPVRHNNVGGNRELVKLHRRTFPAPRFGA